MTYDLLITAVSERADLFVESVPLLLASLDTPPARILVHEDVREGSTPGEIARWLAASGWPHEHRVNAPARGMGPAMLWLFEHAATPIVLYTQEDWRAVRPIPVGAALALMEAHDLQHIRFNKRKTMRAKHADTAHPWEKREVTIGSQTLCVSDHFYTQTSLWRVDRQLPCLRHAAGVAQQANAFAAALNHCLNERYGDGRRPWDDQAMRHGRLRTYIWGPIGEPKFIEHMGTYRTTGPINHVIKQRMREGNPE